jgi:23S rRNA G2069 N7-methylase RlmK/C1962 C5-methylase RlmI
VGLEEVKFRKNPRRYQLTKVAAEIVKKGHPWLFRSHLNSAADIFSSGDTLNLVDANNQTVGYGVFELEGLIAIRVLDRKKKPTVEWLAKKIEEALEKRENLRKYTTAFRAIHGENDGLPGVVFDIFGEFGVLQTYANSVDSLGRYISIHLRKKLNLKTVLWKFPVKRKGGAKEDRILFGKNIDEVSFNEGKIKFKVQPGLGQKTGAFLDLRGLRKWLALQNLNGARVLNLFSYTGTLGYSAEKGGASEIWNVDISKGALEYSKKAHVENQKKYRHIQADIFEWFFDLPLKEKFDLIIVDPPLMASDKKQVPLALQTYRKLYQEGLKHLSPKGKMVACCCSSRISRKEFEDNILKSLGGRLKIVKHIPPEDDHPVGFPEGDYLKICVLG